MLNDARLAEFRQALLDERRALADVDAAGQEDRGTVELDQQSVGRLSRMDALQRQAMAQATSRRRAGRAKRIDAALKRMDDGEFGFCVECGEDISLRRLELDPTIAVCVSCANG